MGIEILQGGLLTTVQDLGRFSYQQFGVSPGGAMDSRSFRLANILVGNDVQEAALEATLMGPQLRFTTPGVFAVTGGDLQPRLNGAPVAMYRAVTAKEGDVLSFVGPKTGCRSYIAFHGGLDVPQVMGSRSTLLRGGIGGYEGRKLRAGDRIGFRVPKKRVSNLQRRQLPQEDFSAREVTLRILLGPQEDRFTERGIQTLLQCPYTVTPECDRMGYRLEGPVIEHTTDANIISDGIALGSIQVPGNGQPIIMMADRQSTGGYTKIGNVISVDLPKLAQCRAGTKLRFCRVEIDEAHALYRSQELQLQRWQREQEILEAWRVVEEDEYSIVLETITDLMEG